MMDEYAIGPLLLHIIELFKQQSTPWPIFFSLPGHWKATRYFCFCQNCDTIRPYIVLLNDWILRNLPSDKASEPEAWSPGPVTNGNPAAFKAWILGWNFKNQDPTWFHMGNWGNQFWGLLDHWKFRSGDAQIAGDQVTHSEFQREFMCDIVTNICYYWCWANIPFYIFAYTFLLLKNCP